MSNSEHITEMISAYIDGELDEDAQAIFEQHVAECAECASALDRTRLVVAAAHSLPAGIAPPTDLWPGIEHTAHSRNRVRIRWAVAAVLVIATGWGVSQQLGDSSSSVASVAPVDQEVDPARAAILAEVDRMEADYLEAFKQLKQSLKDADDVPPEALHTIAENLRIIDGAIDMTRVALHKDPNNRFLMRLLVSVYEQKRQTIEQAKLPARI